MRRTKAVPGLLLALLLGPGLVVQGCSGDNKATAGKTPQQVIAAAQKQLDETKGVTLALTTNNLPSGVTGVETAEGTGIHPAAFDGTLKVSLGGTSLSVPVIAVDGKVYAKIPLTLGWSDVDPGDYGAPDPAALFTPGQGFSAVLAETTGLEQGGSERGGEDNKEVLTTYTGGVSGDTMRKVIPSASGDFKVAYAIDDQGRLRRADLTGVFYPSSASMTYTVTFDDYGTSKDISAP
jgi:lipoprotein LprG